MKTHSLKITHYRNIQWRKWIFLLIVPGIENCRNKNETNEDVYCFRKVMVKSIRHSFALRWFSFDTIGNLFPSHKKTESLASLSKMYVITRACKRLDPARHLAISCSVLSNHDLGQSCLILRTCKVNQLCKFFKDNLVGLARWLSRDGSWGSIL